MDVRTERGEADRDRLEGMRLKTLAWRMEALAVDDARAAFYDDAARSPAGRRGARRRRAHARIPHEWHELAAVPELATTA